MLAGFELTPTAPLGEKQRQHDQASRRPYRVNPSVSQTGTLESGTNTTS